MSYLIYGEVEEGLMKKLAEARDKREFIGILNDFNENFILRYNPRYNNSIGRLPFGSAIEVKGMDNFNRIPPPALQNNMQRSSFSMNSQLAQQYAEPYLTSSTYWNRANINQAQNLTQMQYSPSGYGYQTISNDRNPPIYYQENTINSQFYESGNPFNNNQQNPSIINQQNPPKIGTYSPKISTKELHPKAFITNYKPYQSDTKNYQTEFLNWINLRKKKEAELIGFYKN